MRRQLEARLDLPGGGAETVGRARVKERGGKGGVVCVEMVVVAMERGEEKEAKGGVAGSRTATWARPCALAERGKGWVCLDAPTCRPTHSDTPTRRRRPACRQRPLSYRPFPTFQVLLFLMMCRGTTRGRGQLGVRGCHADTFGVRPPRRRLVVVADRARARRVRSRPYPGSPCSRTSTSGTLPLRASPHPTSWVGRSWWVRGS